MTANEPDVGDGTREGRSLSLRQNFSWTFVGNVVDGACKWGMLVILAKLGSPEMVGEYSLGLAVTAPVIMFLNLQLRAVQVTDAKHEHSFGRYMALRLITTAVGLCVIAAASGLASPEHRLDLALIIIAVGIGKSFESLSDILFGAAQQRERMDIVAKSMILRGPLTLLGMALGVYLTKGVLWGSIGVALALLLRLMTYDVRRCGGVLRGEATRAAETSSGATWLDAIRPHWDWRGLLQIATMALPLGFVMMLGSLNTNIPRYFIQAHLGERELGIFCALAYMQVAGGTIIAALAQSASPRLAKLYAARNADGFRSLMLKLMGIGAAVGATGLLVAFAVGEPVLTLLYKPEYGAHADLFCWLMVAAAVSYVASFLGYGMTATRRFAVQLPLNLSVTAATFLACLFLVPRFGLKGAAMALIIGNIPRLVGSLAVNLSALRALR